MNIFITNSPLQIINANEARCHFGLKPEDCLLIFLDNHGEAHSQQAHYVIRGQSWPNVLTIPLDRQERLATLQRREESRWSKHIVRLLSFFAHRTLGIPLSQVILGKESFRQVRALARKYPNPEYIFIGYYGSPLMRHFANAVDAANTYILDDGANTVVLHEALHSAQKRRTIKQLYFNRWHNYTCRLLFGVNLTPLQHHRLFTAYDLPQTDHVEVVVHQYDEMRKQIGAAETIPEALFLGEWLTEQNYLSDEAYVKYLTQVNHYFASQDLKMVFIPHRRTPESTLDAISSQMGLEIRRLPAPVELVLSKAEMRPTVVSAITSTGLFNVSLMYRDSIKVIEFKMPIRSDRPHLDQCIRDIYDFTEERFSDRISIVPLR